MAYVPFQNLQMGITNRFGWPGLSPQPSFAPIGPAFPPSGNPGQVLPPTSMSNALTPRTMTNTLTDPGRGGNWNGRTLGSSVASNMLGMSGGNPNVGAGLSAPMLPGESAWQKSQAPATMSQALNPSQIPEGYASYNGALGIPYEGKRSAMANPLDFLSVFAGGGMPGGGMLVGGLNELGKALQPDRYIGTLGKYTPEMKAAGVPQTSAGMGAVYGYGPAAKPSAAVVTGKNKDKKGGGRGSDRLGGSGGARGNPTHASGRASGYGGNDRTAKGPGGLLGHI